MSKIKHLLKRDTEQSEKVTESYASIKAKGQASFETKVVNTTQSAPTSENQNAPSTMESIYRGTPVVSYVNLSGVDSLTEGVYKIIINESMDLMYRTGTIEICEKRGYLNRTNVFNTLEGEKLRIRLKGKFESNIFRTFDFDLIECQDVAWANRTGYQLVEAPFYRNYSKELIGRSYDNVKATELIGNILGKDVKTPALKIIENSADPKFSTFIFPNWSAEKCIRYLSSFSDKGPIKVFNVSIVNNTVTVVAPLHYFLSGQVYTEKFDIFPSPSDKVQNGFRLNEWRIYGPKLGDSTNAVAGESAIAFNYLSEKEKSDLNTFTSDDYKFKKENGEEYAASIGGVYSKGVKLFKNTLGSRKIQADSSSVKNHSLFLTPEEKGITKAKLKSNFMQSYYNDLMLTCKLRGDHRVNVGQIFKITIPDTVQEQGISAQKAMESLTGDWLLHDIVHVMEPIAGTAEMSYVLECTFYRVGLEKVNYDRNYGPI